MIQNLTSKLRTSLNLILLTLIAIIISDAVYAKTRHVWEKVEITLYSKQSYENPYTDVEVWVDLKGPGFNKRCYGFWDGGNIFRVRVLATAGGTWTWTSGSNQSDSGLNGKTGKFTATAWSEDELKDNPCRRGMIKASANGHAFKYANGTPFLLLGDTWWSIPSFHYRWYDDDIQRPRSRSRLQGLREIPNEAGLQLFRYDRSASELGQRRQAQQAQSTRRHRRPFGLATARHQERQGHAR